MLSPRHSGHREEEHLRIRLLGIDGSDIGAMLLFAGLAGLHPAPHPREEVYIEALEWARMQRVSIWRGEQ
jgi:endonuclease YncB( thermonuclease family)